MEASILELRGAIDILRSAKKVLRMSGWEGAHYHDATQAAKDAWSILEHCASGCRRELNFFDSKEFKQAAALGRL